MERLRAATAPVTGRGAIGTLVAMEEAEQVLRQADALKVAEEWRVRMYQLAEALYQSSHMQLDLVRYRAIGVDRGATLATAETPLNNRRWLRAQFERIRALPDEAARLKELQAIVGWTDPGPGGFYDDLGNSQLQPHLVRAAGFDEDPGPYRPGSTGFVFRPSVRLSWVTYAESFFDDPLTLRYPELDASARYKLRVVFGGDLATPARIRIVANGTIEISPHVAKSSPPAPMEFDIPAAATAGGSLTLEFTREPGLGGSGMGNQVAEVWLIRTGPARIDSDRPGSPRHQNEAP